MCKSFKMRGGLGTKCIISFIIVFVQSEFSVNNKWKDYHVNCPYNNFCTKNATETITSNETSMVSCCQKCFCDPDCQKFGVCCPDYNLVAGIDVVYPCVFLKDYFNYPRGINPLTKLGLKYHIIDDCQPSFPYRIQCETPVLLEDFIVVTDIETGRIYKNKHCALCHGVDEYEEWGIFTICRAIDQLSFDTFEERDVYVVKYCPIIPYPPASQAASLYRCIEANLAQRYFDKCRYVDETHEVSESIVSACERHTPYTNARIHFRHWYKNIYCIWCNKGIDYNQYLCENFFTFEERTKPPFSMLLETNIRSSDRSEGCNTSSILDPYTGSCLQLYCPPGSIPSFGTCKSVSRESTGIPIAMVYKVQLSDSVENYTSQLRASFNSIIASTLADKIPCGENKIIFGVKSTNVFLISYFKTQDNCTRDFLMSNMLRLLSHSVNINLFYLNTTVEVKLISSTESREMIKKCSSPSETFDVLHNVFRSCARIDSRIVPLLLRMNSDARFLGNIIDNKVCVRDYFTHAESLSNVMCTLEQNLLVLIFNTLLCFGIFT